MLWAHKGGGTGCCGRRLHTTSSGPTACLLLCIKTPVQALRAWCRQHPCLIYYVLASKLSSPLRTQSKRRKKSTPNRASFTLPCLDREPKWEAADKQG